MKMYKRYWLWICRIIMYCSVEVVGQNTLAIYDMYGTSWSWFVNDGWFVATCNVTANGTTLDQEVFRCRNESVGAICKQGSMILKSRLESFRSNECGKPEITADKHTCPKLIKDKDQLIAGGKKHFKYPYHAVCTNGSNHQADSSNTGTLCDFAFNNKSVGMPKHLYRWNCTQDDYIRVRQGARILDFGRTLYISKDPIDITVKLFGFCARKRSHIFVLKPAVNFEQVKIYNVTLPAEQDQHVIPTQGLFDDSVGQQLQLLVDITTTDGEPLAEYVAFLRVIDLDGFGLALHKSKILGRERVQLNCSIDTTEMETALGTVNARIKLSNDKNSKTSELYSVMNIYRNDYRKCYLEIKGPKTCFIFVDNQNWSPVGLYSREQGWRDYNLIATGDGNQNDINPVTIIGALVASACLCLIVFIGIRYKLKVKKNHKSLSKHRRTPTADPNRTNEYELHEQSQFSRTAFPIMPEKTLEESSTFSIFSPDGQTPQNNMATEYGGIGRESYTMSNKNSSHSTPSTKATLQTTASYFVSQDTELGEINCLGKQPTTLPKIGLGVHDMFLEKGDTEFLNQQVKLLFKKNPCKIQEIAPEKMCECRITIDTSVWKNESISQFCNSMKTLKASSLCRIYKKMPKIDDKSFHQAGGNRDRYTDIAVIKKTAVPIRLGLARKTKAYFNANYVSGFGHKNQFICTQGPLDNSVTEFWKIVWQERVVVIVQLARFKEEGRDKCAQYWPHSHDMVMKFKKITVTNMGDVISDQKKDREELGYLISELQIELDGQKRTVYHCFYLRWPDHAIPVDVEGLMTFILVVRKLKQKNKPAAGCALGPPVIVHCSAGIGRTGTYCAITNSIDAIHQQGVVNIPAIVQRLRQERYGSVQTDDQFYFIYLCIFNYIVNFSSKYQSIKPFK